MTCKQSSKLFYLRKLNSGAAFLVNAYGCLFIDIAKKRTETRDVKIIYMVKQIIDNRICMEYNLSVKCVFIENGEYNDFKMGVNRRGAEPLH